MSDVLLIAGLGPAHLSHADRDGSFFSPSFSDEDSYVLDGYRYFPTDLAEIQGDTERKLLQPRTEAELISNHLCTVFDNAKISYDFLHIKSIWNNSIIENDKYSIICLSTSFMWSEYMLDYAIEWIFQNIKFDYLIVGGQYAALKKDYVLNKWQNVSFVSIGDADISLVPLVNCLLSGKDWRAVPCISWCENSIVKQTAYKETDINSNFIVEFKNSYHMIPYIAMRGCPYHCAFCAQSECCPVWQYRSAEQIANDWKLFKNQGYNHIDVHDSTFFIPFKKIEELLPLIFDVGVTWSANCRADTPLTDENCKLLEKSGCIDLYFGFESMSDTVLGYMNKNTTSSQNRYINQLFSNSKINTTMSFIVGFPGENPTEFYKTRDYLLNEHIGFFTSAVFELEDERIPIWKQRNRFNIQLYKDKNDDFKWRHGGNNWSHCGMTSKEAQSLRECLINDIRNSDSSLAVCRSWQYQFLFPIVSRQNKKTTMRIEKLLDRLVYLNKDYHTKEEKQAALKKIVAELNYHGIFGTKI
ncbi:MAG: radical SAM protein [Clostridia bacterium]|nr:radical SAM protein [Clostridia bacterium]